MMILNHLHNQKNNKILQLSNNRINLRKTKPSLKVYWRHKAPITLQKVGFLTVIWVFYLSCFNSINWLFWRSFYAHVPRRECLHEPLLLLQERVRSSRRRSLLGECVLWNFYCFKENQHYEIR